MPGIRDPNGEAVSERWDRVFDAVSAEPRRQVVLSLLEADDDDPVSLPESAVNPNVPTDWNQLRMALYHRHLPLLEQSDFVEWDSDPLVAYRGDRFAEVATVFELIQSNAARLPDSLVEGCRRLEHRRRGEFDR